MGKGLKYYWKFQAALILRFPHTGQSTWCSRLSLNLCLAQQCVQAVAGVTLWSLSGCAGGPVSGAKEGWKKNYRMREKRLQAPSFFPSLQLQMLWGSQATRRGKTHQDTCLYICVVLMLLYISSRSTFFSIVEIYMSKPGYSFCWKRERYHNFMVILEVAVFAGFKLYYI